MTTEQFCFSSLKKRMKAEKKNQRQQQMFTISTQAPFYFVLVIKIKKGNSVKYLESLYGCQFIIRVPRKKRNI